MEQSLDLRYYWDAFKRRFWVMVLTAFVVSIIGAAVAYLLPPKYEASAKILVQSQQIPSELAQSTVTTSATETIQVLQTKLLTRSNLLEIVQKFQLFKDRPDMSQSEIVDAMRDSTSFEQIIFGNPNQRRTAGATAFSIAFKTDSALKSSQVTNEFVSLILAQNLKDRSERATETYAFFEAEEDRLSKELIALESQMLAFKKENEDALPDSLNYRRGELLAAQERLLTLDRQLATLREEEKFLDRLVASGASLSGNDEDLTDDELQLRELKRQMAQARAIYAESHPNIRAMQRRVDTLEASVAAEAAIRAGVDPDNAEFAALNPTEQRLSLIRRQLTLLQDQYEELTERQASLEVTIADTPRVEIALNALDREYGDLNQQYREVQQKKADAATGERLEANRQAERFEIIEQATVPEEPVSPNRPLILLGGVGAGIVAGLLMILLLEKIDSSIRRPRDLETQLELRPLAVLPVIITAAERQRRKWRRRIGFLGVTGSVTAALAAVHVFYLPLDFLVERAMQKAQIDGFIEIVRNRVGL